MLYCTLYVHKCINNILIILSSYLEEFRINKFTETKKCVKICHFVGPIYLLFFYIKNNCRVFKITPEFDIGIIRSGQLFKGLIKKKIHVILSFQQVPRVCSY